MLKRPKSASRSSSIPPAFEFGLAGDVRALLRPIRPDDAPRFERAYGRLSEQSRRQRFFGQASALSKTQLDFLTRLDQVRHVAWGALDYGLADQPGIGVGRYIEVPDRPKAVEVALTIVDHYQHRGAGTLLHACLHLTAASHGYETLVYDVSQDNERFLAYLKALGGIVLGQAEHILRLEMPVYRGAAQVPRVTPTGLRFATLMREIAKAVPVDA